LNLSGSEFLSNLIFRERIPNRILYDRIEKDAVSLLIPKISMDKKSKILFLVFFIVLAGSVLVTYYRYIVIKDYIIEAQINCDPMAEACFVSVCDPENGEECTGNPEEDISYYKILHRNAKYIPLCDPQAADCPVASCQSAEEDCLVTLCDASMEDAVCSDPDIYLREHPTRDATEETFQNNSE